MRVPSYTLCLVCISPTPRDPAPFEWTGRLSEHFYLVSGLFMFQELIIERHRCVGKEPWAFIVSGPFGMMRIRLTIYQIIIPKIVNNEPVGWFFFYQGTLLMVQKYATFWMYKTLVKNWELSTNLNRFFLPHFWVGGGRSKQKPWIYHPPRMQSWKVNVSCHPGADDWILGRGGKPKKRFVSRTIVAIDKT